MNDKASASPIENPSNKNNSDKLLFIAFLLVVAMLLFWFLQYWFSFHAETLILDLLFNLTKVLCALATITLAMYLLFKRKIKYSIVLLISIVIVFWFTHIVSWDIIRLNAQKSRAETKYGIMGYVYEVEKFRFNNGEVPKDNDEFQERISSVNRLMNISSEDLEYSRRDNGEYELYYYNSYSGEALSFISNKIEGEYVFSP